MIGGMKPLLPLLLCVATAALAQAPAPVPTQRAPAPAPRRIEGMSDAGNAIFAKAQTTRDPDYIALLRQQRTLHDQLIGAASAAKIDVDKIGNIMQQQEDVSAQLRVKFDQRNLDVLRQLPDADRGIFLRALMAPPPTVAPAR
jgi:hypothetical protein